MTQSTTRASLATSEQTEQRPSRVWTINGLGAQGPLPEFKEKMMLFGQFVGDWETEFQYPGADGAWIKRKGEIHFGWILEGRAIQDVWMGKDERTGNPTPAGTTLRYYDPGIDAWHIVWFSPRQGVVQTLVARKEGDEIVLRGKTKDGYPERWTFYEISPASFLWRAEESHDNEKTWLRTEEVRARRIETANPSKQ